MRDAIRNRLLTIVTELNAVYDLHTATASSDKPYAMILFDEEIEASNWVGFRQMIEIRPYVAQSSFVTVDQLAKAITTALENEALQTSGGHVFSCMYLGSGTDQVDTELQAITKGLRFVVVATHEVDMPEIAADDSWLEALAEWTEDLLALEPPTEDVWHVYRARWPHGYLRPAVLWRLIEFDTHVVSKAVFEVRKRFIGHVLGRTPNEQASAVVQLIEQLQTVMKLPLNVVERKFMTVVEPKANLLANAIADGQISVTLTRKVNRSSGATPLMAGLQQIGNIE